MIHISDRFDAGNIVVRDLASDELRLAIRPDVGNEHMQWFYFRVAGARGRELRWRLENAGEASYPKGWPGYRVCASYNREDWFRVETAYEDGELVVTHEVTEDLVWYAYFAPYSWQRHERVVANTTAAVDVLTATLDGRPIDRLIHGHGEVPVWIIARQHPGESMAEWLVEGLLERLDDPADALARALKERATFHIVPNMNPDGSVRGHLRTNAAGKNLNRVWADPQTETEPEVHAVRAAMDASGVAVCLDVHGDEALPYN
ncbi:MAG: M14-type cytosolic carboxypeptidase, partial [Myxococcota bacterium]